ncbi:flagellar biosynthetic protein FliO [Arthrobacter sp. GMC3]|uniref:FliO/MopB family protein n=1 Tax=Arthrobacter sp. GMC3 TaxID=2058894 RepID=UPI000CE561D4|nr:flagellar biosynthetic protein FliO [Arthrobacter sp. GMC3]
MDTFLLILRVGLALAVVMLLLWMAQKKLAKGNSGGAGVHLDVVSRRNVGQKASVVMVDADGMRFLLGVTEHNVSVLHSGPAPEPEPAFSAALEYAGTADGLIQPSSDKRPRSEPNPLSGSILSPKTWQQAWAAVRKGFNL